MEKATRTRSFIALAAVCATAIVVLSGAQQREGARPPYSTAHSLSTPTLFAEGVISTSDMELNAAFTPDGKTVYFTKRTPKYQFWAILVSTFKRGAWSTPEVASFSGQYGDFDPFITPDGSKLFWSSSRPVEGQPAAGFDIWMVERTATGWDNPKALGAPVNSNGPEYYPSVSSNGTLYFSSVRPGGAGALDIYRSRFVDGKYAEPESLGDSVNSKLSEGDPYIAPDESYLLFVSYGRPEGSGDGDLYISRNVGGVWSKAQNLGPTINSSALDFCPIVSPNGKYLFFTSERGFADAPLTQRLTYSELMKRIRSTTNGLGNIYQVDLDAILRR